MPMPATSASPMPYTPSCPASLMALGQERQQRGAQQRAGGEAHQVRQGERAHALGQHEKKAGDRYAERAGDDGGKQDPAERGQGSLSSCAEGSGKAARS